MNTQAQTWKPEQTFTEDRTTGPVAFALCFAVLLNLLIVLGSNGIRVGDRGTVRSEVLFTLVPLPSGWGPTGCGPIEWCPKKPVAPPRPALPSFFAPLDRTISVPTTMLPAAPAFDDGISLFPGIGRSFPIPREEEEDEEKRSQRP